LIEFTGVTKEQLLADTELLAAVLGYDVLGARVLKADVARKEALQVTGAALDLLPP